MKLSSVEYQYELILREVSELDKKRTIKYWI